MPISMLKIRRPLGRLIFNMGIAIPGKTVSLIETAPCWLLSFLCTVQDKQVFVFNEEIFQLPMPPEYWDRMENKTNMSDKNAR